MTTVCGSVDLPYSAREQSVHHVSGQVKICEVE
jgi:hypothetical protein